MLTRRRSRFGGRGQLRWRAERTSFGGRKKLLRSGKNLLRRDKDLLRRDEDLLRRDEDLLRRDEDLLRRGKELLRSNRTVGARALAEASS